MLAENGVGVQRIEAPMPKVVFEFGVVGMLGGDDSVELSRPHWPEKFDSIEGVYKRYGIRPIALLGAIPFEPDSCEFFFWRDWVLRDEPHYHKLSFIEDMARQRHNRIRVDAESSHEEALARATDSVMHRLGAVRYHLERLVLTYLDLTNVGAAWFDEDARLPGLVAAIEPLDLTKEEVLRSVAPTLAWTGEVPGLRLGTHMLSGGPSESVFFEQQSFLSAARIVLDRVQPLLSLERWSRKMTLPRSFEKLAAVAEVSAPRRLATTLNRVRDWSNELIAYRDCVEHFAELAPAGMLDTDGVFNSEGYIASTCMLPDNPAARSRQKFTFEIGVDCLSYSCETYARLLFAVEGLVEHAANDIAVAKRQAARRESRRRQ